MKYDIKVFARKKNIDLNQLIYSNNGNHNSLQDLLEEYADRCYKHKEGYRVKGNETDCMSNLKQQGDE